MAETENGDAKVRKTKRSAEEHRQLLTHHMSKLRAKRAQVEDLRAPLKEAQEDLTALFNEAKADLGKGYTRKYLATLLEDTTTRLRNLLEEEQRRAVDREALGLPVFGVQADLFDNEQTAKMPAEARDELAWEAEGYMRGRNGALDQIPEGAPPRFHQAIMKGYERGQQQTQADVLAAMELKKREAEPDPAPKPDLNATPPTIADEKAQERKAVARAKASLESMGDAANKVAA